MAGLRSQALRPAARSWLTGVAGPRSRKRGPRIAERRRGAPEGAFLRFATEERDARKTSHGRVSQTAHRGPRKPQRLPALRSPRWGPGIAIRDEGVPGADQRIRATTRALVIPGRAPPWSFRGARRKRVHARLRGTRASPESILRSIKKEINAVPNTSTAAYGFRVRPFGPPRNDGMFASE